jgi:hypothetical protein
MVVATSQRGGGRLIAAQMQQRRAIEAARIANASKPVLHIAVPPSILPPVDESGVAAGPPPACGPAEPLPHHRPALLGRPAPARCRYTGIQNAPPGNVGP